MKLKKYNLKKVWILIISIVLGVALLIGLGLLIYFKVVTKPSNKIPNTSDNTIEETTKTEDTYLISVGNYVKSILPSSTKENIIFSSNLEEYPDVVIIYTSSNLEAIDQTGTVTRSTIDVTVEIKIEVQYKSSIEQNTYICYKNIIVEKVNNEDQLGLLYQYMQETYFDHILNNTDTALPTSVDGYSWELSYVGVYEHNGSTYVKLEEDPNISLSTGNVLSVHGLTTNRDIVVVILFSNNALGRTQTYNFSSHIEA